MSGETDAPPRRPAAVGRDVHGPHVGDGPGPNAPAAPSQPGEGLRYAICERIDLAWHTRLRRHRPDEPVHRRLRIYALNPGEWRRDGGVATVEVPYEPLAPGPTGSVLEVDGRDARGKVWPAADLENPCVTMRDGVTPSLSDPCFHQQMVYAVAMRTYDSFRVALGRHVSWAFPRRDEQGDGGHNRLRLRPHGAEEANAWYDPVAGEIVFGHFLAERSTPMVQKGRGRVFTSVSHDVIAHEMSHALLDGLRARFMVPSHPDVLAFHEAFADLVAVFQHFTLENVVRAALGKSRGRLDEAHVLVDIAREFGRALEGGGRALRTFGRNGAAAACGETVEDAGVEAGADDGTTDPHRRGQRLAKAVFRAFVTIYERRSRVYVKLATGGSGRLPDGDLPSGLEDALVAEVSKVARQFLTICIRAIDYCPPVDVRFGDYLRALITADHDVVVEDDLGYREAIIRAFGELGLYGENACSMSEDALLWQAPRMPIEPLAGLSFSRMAFDGDPARPVSQAEMRRQAGVLGRFVARASVASEFGLVSPDSAAWHTGDYALPLIESVRSVRRVGPAKEVTFGTVAEITQARRVALPGGRRFTFFGGSTVILGPCGEVRFVIRKRVDDDAGRLREQRAFMDSAAGERLWVTRGAERQPAADIARRLCLHDTPARDVPA